MKRSERKSSSEKRLDDVLLVLDENLAGRSIFDALKSAGLPVRHQMEFVRRGAPDTEVAAGLAKHPNCVLLTRDSDFRYKHDLVKQLMSARLRVFAVTAAGNKRGEEIVSQIVQAWPRIQRFLKKHPAPFVAKISGNSSIIMDKQ